MDRSNYPGFEAIPDAVLVMGRDAVIVHANLHAERLFGYDPGTLIGRPAAALVPKEQRDRLARWIEEYLAKPESPPLGLAREFPALKNDGQEFPAEISLGLGGGRRIVALVRDITAALRTRERLHESERRFHIAASHAAVLVQYVDLERDLFVLFGTTDGLMGFKRDDIPTSFAAWYERMHPEDADRVRAETERIVKQGLGGWSFRYRIRGKDGSYYHWLDHGTFTEFIDGRPSAGIGVVVDETSEIKTRQTLDRMAQDLRRQDGVTRALLSSLSSHIAVLDRDGEIIVVNDAWSEFRRANDPSSLDEYVSGANYLEACRKSGASEALAGIRSVLDGSTPRFEMEFDCHTPSEKRWFSMVVTPIKTDGGGAIVTNHDVTWQVVGREEMATTMKEVERLRDQLQADTRYLMEEVRTDHDFETIIGRSSRMMATLYKVKQVARTDAAVLLLGETGTGKELLARAIHARSSRSGRPLVKVDCATLPPGLIESELFGHEKGAFTGAERAKPGRFELADGATVFLDEIGELPVELQPKLLRVLEEGEIQRIGGTQVQRVDVRVIAATNRDLNREMHEGRFRSDLYYRIGVFPIEIPPLRDRRDDIPLLASFFITRLNKVHAKNVESIPRAVMDALLSYDWPGNIRELQNVLERSLILTSGHELRLAESLGKAELSLRGAGGRLKQDLKGVERTRILEALQASSWRIKGKDNAASRLGLKPSTLRSRMNRLGIERPH
jgi:PAS domain S-box-containing protein